MNPVPRLYERPEVRGFAAAEEGRLVAALDALTRDTLVAEVGELRELKMDATGQLRDGYRYTSTGLKQVCGIACAGLYPAIVDLAGVGRDPSGDRSDYSFEEAVRTYNRAITLRHSGRFEGKQRLLRNVREKLIEGVLGPRYTLIENGEIFERATQVAAARDRPCRFHEASLVGRRLMLRFVEHDPLFALPEGATYRGGLHFANSEVGGESTVRAAVLLLRDLDQTTSLGRFLGGRQVHAGRDFLRKLAWVFGEATRSPQDPEKLRAAMLGLARTPLGLAGLEYERLTERVRQIAGVLHEHQVPLGVGQKAVNQAVYCGSAPAGAADLAYPTAGTLARRHALDLYTALTVVAAGLHATAGEAVQQAAYGLILGKVVLR